MAKEEEELDTEATIEEEETSTEEVVAEEETTEEVVEYDVEEDVNALLGGEELSEDFKAKAKTIFEAAINSKVAGIKEELEAKYAAALEEQVAEVLRRNSLSVLTPIWSMSLMSGSPKMPLP